MAFIKSINTRGVTTTVTTSSEVTIAPKIRSAIIIENDGEATTHTAWKDLHKEGLPHNNIWWYLLLGVLQIRNDINTSCPIKINSNTIELIVQTSFYCALDLLYVIYKLPYYSIHLTFYLIIKLYRQWLPTKSV